MTPRPENRRQIFVLDTNVLMHDPTALFRFQEHDVYLPMVVLEELDQGKKGLSEVARNARQASRFLDDLVSGSSHEEIERGLLQIYNNGNGRCGDLDYRSKRNASFQPKIRSLMSFVVWAASNASNA